MFDDQTTQAQTPLLERLRHVLLNAQTRVSTPLADALFTVLGVDRRLRNENTENRSSALTDDELIELAADLDRALDGGTAFKLPFGSRVTSGTLGSVVIDGECLVLDADCAGLFPLEATSAAAQGRNFDMLCVEIKRLTAKLACRRIGLPMSVKRARVDVEHLLQFPPFADGGDVVLQRKAEAVGAARFCAASQKEIREFAKNIVLDMRSLWSKRRAISEQVGRVREAACEAAMRAPASPSVVAITTELSYQRETDDHGFFVEYLAVDEAMRSGMVIHYVVQTADLGEEFNRLPWGVSGRVNNQTLLKRAGADGWIDDVSLAALAAAPEGRDQVLSVLSTEYETMIEIEVGNKPLFATFYWRDGYIETELCVPGKLQSRGSEIELFDLQIAETIIASLPGYRLDEIVELPFECACAITEADRVSPNRLRLYLDNKMQFINLTSGKVWPVPPAMG